MNSVKLQDTKSTYKNLLFLYISCVSNSKLSEKEMIKQSLYNSIINKNTINNTNNKILRNKFTLCTLNLYNIICQLYLFKAGKTVRTNKHIQQSCRVQNQHTKISCTSIH